MNAPGPRYAPVGAGESSVLPGFEHVRRYWDPAQGSMTAKVLPGEFYVSMQDELIATVLGSCVSACIRDRRRNIGGMNHFMLPEPMGERDGWSATVGRAARYGNDAMEQLINAILKAGGKREDLEVKVFGGGRVLTQMTDIGERNIAFVRRYLAAERLDLAAAGLIIKEYDWLVTVLAAAIGPHVRCAGGLLVLFLQDLNRRLIAMNERLRSQPQFQRIIDAEEVLLARTDHPVSESAAADRNTSTLECLRHAVERRAINVFVDQREGQRRGRGDAARQGLRRHWRDHDRRVDPGAVTMAASVLEAHILQDLRLDLDMELLGHGLAHAMHLMIAAGTGLLVFGKVVFDTLARQICRQRPAATLLARRAFDRWQTCIGEIDDVVAGITVATVIVAHRLFGFVEEAVDVLFAARSKTMELCECQFLFQLDDPKRQRILLGFERGDFGSICRQLRHQFCNAWLTGSRHQILESEPALRVNSSIRHPQPAI